MMIQRHRDFANAVLWAFEAHYDDPIGLEFRHKIRIMEMILLSLWSEIINGIH